MVMYSMKRISNHSEQRLFREEILSFIQEKAKAFSLLFEPPFGGEMELVCNRQEN